MKALELYIPLTVAPGSAYAEASATALRSEWAAVQPYIQGRILDSNGNLTDNGAASASARMQIFDGATVLVDVTISSSASSSNKGTASFTSSINVAWAVGYNASPDVPTFESGTFRPSRVPNVQGTYPPSGAGYAAYQWYAAGDYTVVYVPPTAVIRVSGASNQLGGFALSTVPKAAFTVSGASTGTIGADGTASLDSTLVPNFPTYIDDPDNFITAYIWTWGDGSPPETNSGPLASHTYAAAGTYTVGLEVRDKYAGRHRTSQSITVTVETGRLISFVCDPSGFYVRRKIETISGAQVLATSRYDGQEWKQVHSTSTLDKAAVSCTREPSRLFSLAQNKSSKAWPLEVSDDLGATWTVMSQPFDSTYKAVSRVAWGLGIGVAVGINASNVLIARRSFDQGVTWETFTSPGSASKSVDLDWDAERSRLVLLADNLAKTCSDFGTPVPTWQNL